MEGVTATGDLENLSFKQLEQVPEIRAVFSVMNRYRPEVHADVHGNRTPGVSPGQAG